MKYPSFKIVFFYRITQQEHKKCDAKPVAYKYRYLYADVI